MLLSTSRKLAKRITAAFRKKGVDLCWAQEAEHLGVGRCTHRGRVFAALAKRFKKAKRSASRVGLLARATAKAAGLARSGVIPQATYGADVIGLSYTLHNRLDAMMRGITAPGGYDSCSITADAPQWQGSGGCLGICQIARWQSLEVETLALRQAACSAGLVG